MPCIRRIYHYAAVYLSPELREGKMPACGQTVETVSGNTRKNTPFYGFTELMALASHDAILITGLTGYSPSTEIMGPWMDLARDAMYLGCVNRDGVQLVVAGDKPVKVAGDLPSDKPPARNNVVVSLRR